MGGVINLSDTEDEDIVFWVTKGVPDGRRGAGGAVVRRSGQVEQPIGVSDIAIVIDW